MNRLTLCTRKSMMWLAWVLLASVPSHADEPRHRKHKVPPPPVPAPDAAGKASIAPAGPTAIAPAGSATSGAVVRPDQPSDPQHQAVPKMPLFVRAAPATDALHLTVGGSMFVNTQQRLAKVYVANPAVIDAYTASPNQILFTAKAPGLSAVTVWDEFGDTQTYLVSSDTDVDMLRNTIKHSLPHEDIEVESREGRIALIGSVSTAAVADSAMKLAGGYAKDVSNGLLINAAIVKQVRLKVRILEVDRTRLDQFGFNFFSTAGGLLAQSTTGQFTSTLTTAAGAGAGVGSLVGGTTVSVSNPLNFLVYSSKLNIGATLQDLQTRSVLQILAEPNITTMSGEKANFLAGGEFPFPVVQGGTGSQTAVTIQFRPYGVKLEFTPVVNVDGTIALKVAPEVSALDYSNAVSINGYSIPALSTRRAETQVVLQSDQSFAISGLLDKNTTDSYSHTPGIASVPILGALFKSKQLNHTTTELIVIVTPTIVNPLAESVVQQEPTLVTPLPDQGQFDKLFPKPKTP